MKQFKIHPGTRALYRRVFANDSVVTRYFAIDQLDDVMDPDPDRVNRRFEKEAVRLSVRSLTSALRQAGIKPTDLGFLAVTTCTGYVCPGLAPQVLEAARIPPTIQYADLVGMGCGAALPALQAADNYCQNHPGKFAAVISTEVCSAAMYSDDAPDLVVSNALFGDGSAAVVLRAGPGPGPAFINFSSLVVPEWREGLRFRSQNGRLRNVLSKEVPDRAAQAMSILLRDLLSRSGVKRSAIHRWIAHAGGAKVLDALEKALQLGPRDLDASRAVLRRFGNLSSPSVLFVLKESLARTPPREREMMIMASFGAGFSAHAALLKF